MFSVGLCCNPANAMPLHFSLLLARLTHPLPLELDRPWLMRGSKNANLVGARCFNGSWNSPIADLNEGRHGGKEEKGKEKRNASTMESNRCVEFASNASSITAFEKASRALPSGRLLKRSATEFLRKEQMRSLTHIRELHDGL